MYTVPKNPETPLPVKVDLDGPWSSTICPGERPDKWAQTLRKLEALDYRILVPGHGRIQHDTAYVDLLIETVASMVEQCASLLQSGLSHEEAQQKLDFSRFEPRCTGGNELYEERFQAWFAQPFAAAAFKELSGKPMVEVGPSAYDE